MGLLRKPYSHYPLLSLVRGVKATSQKQLGALDRFADPCDLDTTHSIPVTRLAFIRERVLGGARTFPDLNSKSAKQDASGLLMSCAQ